MPTKRKRPTVAEPKVQLKIEPKVELSDETSLAGLPEKCSPDLSSDVPKDLDNTVAPIDPETLAPHVVVRAALQAQFIAPVSLQPVTEPRMVKRRMHRTKVPRATPASLTVSKDGRPLVKHLFRVQHAEAFTQFDMAKGFEIQDNYTIVDYHTWMNEEMFRNHLTATQMPNRTTPFISLFASYKEVTALAVRWQAQGYKDVLIARIPTNTLERVSIEISPPGHIGVYLPVWQDTATAVLFVTAIDVSHYLGVDAEAHLSEWFAMARIPASMIQSLERFN